MVWYIGNRDEEMSNLFETVTKERLLRIEEKILEIESLLKDKGMYNCTRCGEDIRKCRKLHDKIKGE